MHEGFSIRYIVRDVVERTFVERREGRRAWGSGGGMRCGGAGSLVAVSARAVNSVGGGGRSGVVVVDDVQDGERD